MKKLILLIMSAFFVIQLQAQPNTYPNEVYLGFKGGTAFSRVRFYPTVKQNMLQGYCGGIVFRDISEAHVGLQIELNYSQRGWKEPTDAGVDYERQLDYFVLPLMTHVNIGNNAFRFFINLGPSVSYLYTDKEIFNPPANATYTPNDYYGKPVDAGIDFQFVGGLGFEWRFKNGNGLMLDSRLYYSLPSLFDPKKSTYDASQLQTIEVSMAYLFRLNKHRKKKD
jgi:hypothetical protein